MSVLLGVTGFDDAAATLRVLFRPGPGVFVVGGTSILIDTEALRSIRRLSVEFHLFFMALSVRPCNFAAIFAHALPSSACSSMIV